MSAFDNTNTAFIAWLKASGATISDSIALKDYSEEGAGRGVIATKDIAKNEELFKIPRDLLLSPTTSDLFTQLKEDEVEKFENWDGMFCCMIYEYCRGADSKWKAYFDILPTEFSTPMFWTDDEVAELKGTGIDGRIGKEDADATFDNKIYPVIMNHTDLYPVSKDKEEYRKIFHQMGSLIMAYAFHNDNEDDSDEDDEDGYDSDGSAIKKPPVINMVPMADMLNHKTGHNNARLFHEETCLRMVAIKPIKAQKQIYNTYGDLPNSDLLRKYGFVDQPNEFNICEIPTRSFVTKFSTVGTKEDQDFKMQWLLEQGVIEDVFVLESGEDLPEGLVGCANVMLLADDFFRTKIVEQSKTPEVGMTELCQGPMLELLEEKLAEYVGDQKEDQEALKNGKDLSVQKRNALIVRCGERDILEKAIKKLKSWKPKVKKVVVASAGGKAKTPAKGQPAAKGTKPYAKK